MPLRALHWVLKTGDRAATAEFLHETLGMHCLRHEEFGEPCKASCNGPFDGKWSKSMLGYGPEAENFLLELTYTYNVKTYAVGNDLRWIKIKNRAVYNGLVEQGLGTQLEMREIEIRSPVVEEGYRFHIVGEDPTPDVGAICSVCLNVTSLEQSLSFWVDVLGLLEIDRGDDYVTLSCGATSATLRLTELSRGEKLVRGNGYGRLALSCPFDSLQVLQDSAAAAGFSVLTSLTGLQTPGKAEVYVVVLADPNGHEVCLVGDEAFRRLSRVDEAAPQLLGEAIAKDLSKDWFEKKKKGGGKSGSGESSGDASNATAAESTAAK